MGYSKPEMLAPDATIPMAKPFLALNQVDTTTFDSDQHMIYFLSDTLVLVGENGEASGRSVPCEEVTKKQDMPNPVRKP